MSALLRLQRKLEERRTAAATGQLDCNVQYRVPGPTGSRASMTSELTETTELMRQVAPILRTDDQQLVLTYLAYLHNRIEVTHPILENITAGIQHTWLELARLYAPVRSEQELRNRIETHPTDPRAYLLLGDMKMYALNGCVRDPNAAGKLWYEAAELGDPEAMTQVAMMGTRRLASDNPTYATRLSEAELSGCTPVATLIPSVRNDPMYHQIIYWVGRAYTVAKYISPWSLQLIEQAVHVCDLARMKTEVEGAEACLAAMVQRYYDVTLQQTRAAIRVRRNPGRRPARLWLSVEQEKEAAAAMAFRDKMRKAAIAEAIAAVGPPKPTGSQLEPQQQEHERARIARRKNQKNRKKRRTKKQQQQKEKQQNDAGSSHIDQRMFATDSGDQGESERNSLDSKDMLSDEEKEGDGSGEDADAGDISDETKSEQPGRVCGSGCGQEVNELEVKQELECCICLEEADDSWHMLSCHPTHQLHRSCSDEWRQQCSRKGLSPTCPICRANWS